LSQVTEFTECRGNKEEHVGQDVLTASTKKISENINKKLEKVWEDL
jgi:hypothetical protein